MSREKLPSGWKRPERHARWWSECIELVVAYGGWDTRWIAYARMHGESWEIGEYPSEREAMDAAEDYARKLLKKTIGRLERNLTKRDQ